MLKSEAEIGDAVQFCHDVLPALQHVLGFEFHAIPLKNDPFCVVLEQYLTCFQNPRCGIACL